MCHFLIRMERPGEGVRLVRVKPASITPERVKAIASKPGILNPLKGSDP
ncbi:MAG TPA: hypothetical protein V6D27_08160 [Vampirovibrionales bacterium]